MASSTLLLCALALLAISLAWRLASTRQSLPCPVWLRWLVELDNPFTRTNRAAFIVEQLGVVPGMNVLDAGCGPGRLAIPLARAVGPAGSVLAVDIQQGMLERTRTKASDEQLENITCLHAGLGEDRLPRQAFDRAVLVTVLGEIPAQGKALAEIHQALRPGGVLSITEVIFDPHFQSRSRVRRLANDAGFREKAAFGNRIAYVLHFERPCSPKTDSSSCVADAAGKRDNW